MSATPDLWVRQHVLDRLQALRGRPWEIGGWLLGYRTPDAIVVTHATPPASRGTPFHVTISGKGHSSAFDRVWDATGGHVTFLGHWHTHPGGPVWPSGRDRLAVADMAQDPDFRTAEPLLGIVGTSRLWTQAGNSIGFFRGNRTGETRPLPIQPYSSLPVPASGYEPWAVRGKLGVDSEAQAR